MAPKKKEVQKLSYGEFMANDAFGGSWADEVEETVGTQALPALERRGGASGGFYGSSNNDRGSYSSYQRSDVPQRIPDKPPYLAHLGNLDYEIEEDHIRELLEGCNVTSIRLIQDRETNRPKGFGYAEFAEVDGLKQALDLDGVSFRGRNIKVKIADPPKEREFRGGESSRDLSEWTRKGPLPDLPGRTTERRPAPDFSERRAPREAAPEDKPARDITWERKGPLAPLPQAERPATEAPAGGAEGFRAPRKTPAQWGEARNESAPAGPGSDSGRPARREFTERPERSERPERAERAPTAAERDMQWRTSMRPDAPEKPAAAPSRSGSEAPTSPAPAAATLASRPKLNLAKRTVSEATDAAAAAGGDSKASPFGAARPIDTATREREVEEKRQIALKEKKEADEKAKEEARKAKEAAAAEEKAKEEKAVEAPAATEEAPAAAATEEAAPAEAAAAEPAERPATAAAALAAGLPPTPTTAAPAGDKTQTQNGARGPRTREPREPREPRDQVQNAKSRANDSGNWRNASGGARGGARGGDRERGDRTGENGQRRGSGAPRGGRSDGPRPPRQNQNQNQNGNGATSTPPTPRTATAPAPTEEGAAAPAAAGGVAPDNDGWETVPNKSRRNQRPRGQ